MSGTATIKCLVWDLDGTVWDGTLLEDRSVSLRDGVAEVIAELDRRGILQSVASKNEEADALGKLKEFGLDQYFLFPRINWGPKSDSVGEIARLLNLGLETFAFIDDTPFEREEVALRHPAVRVYDARDYAKLTALAEFTPRFITPDSALRRRMYMDDIERKEREESFEGTKDDFLKSLDMELTLSPVTPGDLERVEELTVRTNQLNSTGATYSYEQLSAMIGSDVALFMIAGLADKFGDYGKIGLILAERSEKALKIKLLLMSCRVMTRGVGSALLAWAINHALDESLVLQADFVSTPRNRIMYITYKLMGFTEISRSGDICLLQYEGGRRELPDYFRLKT